MLNVEERVATGLKPAMTAREAHKGSVAVVAGKQAELEVEKVEHCFARKVEFECEGPEHCFAREVEIECEEVEHCSARTAAMLQYFLAEAGIEAGYCRMRNWVVR